MQFSIDSDTTHVNVSLSNMQFAVITVGGYVIVKRVAKKVRKIKRYRVVTTTI